MRGKVAFSDVELDAQRITPAYAGKSLSCLILTAEEKDHPRLCGEKMKSIRNIASSVGSPPPMRGKVAF